jgi:hypothetical protein
VDFGRVNGNLALSRAIGDFEFKKSAELAPEQQIVTAYPDVLVHDLSDDDEFLVIACDGELSLCCKYTSPRRVLIVHHLGRYLGLPSFAGSRRVCQTGDRSPSGTGQDLRELDGQLPGLDLGNGRRGLRQHDHHDHCFAPRTYEGRVVRGDRPPGR